MGVLLSKYKSSLVEDILTSVSTNNSLYYAFGSNPVSVSGANVSLTTDEFSTKFSPDWQMLFGKRLSNNDIIPVIKNIPWQSGHIYDRYDNRNANLHSLNYYVIADSSVISGDHDIYLCLDNANNSPSYILPDTRQTTSIKKSDGYIWRYVASVSDAIYNRFTASTYAPVYSNNTLKTSASLYSGVDVVVVVDGGNNYTTYANGIVQATPYPDLIQIEDSKSQIQNFYTNCAVYIYTPQYSTAEIKLITGYTTGRNPVTGKIGNYIQLDSYANTNNIIPGITQYSISPAVVFNTDGDTSPIAFSVINAVSNSIYGITVIETGSNISRANVHIKPGYSDTNPVGFRAANIYAITSPPGGYGYDPVSELNVQGLSMAFSFANNEGDTIPTEVLYNKIGIIKNPYLLDANTGNPTTYAWTNNSFNTTLQGNTAPETVFTVGDTVLGVNSGAVGVVAFSNTSVLYLSGDKHFTNGETIVSQTQLNLSAELIINTRGDIYAKGLEPLYIQTLSDVQRSNSQTESYKLVIQI